MREFLFCSAIVITLLTIEYVRWLQQPALHFPFVRAGAWINLGFAGFLAWIGLAWVAAALLVFLINIIGVLALVQHLYAWWLLWISRRAVQKEPQ